MANKIPASAIFVTLLAIFHDVLSCARMDGCALAMVVRKNLTMSTDIKMVNTTRTSLCGLS